MSSNPRHMSSHFLKPVNYTFLQMPIFVHRITVALLHSWQLKRLADWQIATSIQPCSEQFNKGYPWIYIFKSQHSQTFFNSNPERLSEINDTLLYSHTVWINVLTNNPCPCCPRVAAPLLSPGSHKQHLEEPSHWPPKALVSTAVTRKIP